MANKKKLMSEQEYQGAIKNAAPEQHVVRNTIRAFWVGGAICMVGQGFKELFLALNIEEKMAGNICSIVMVFLGALLTGLNIYKHIGKYAGAGSIVPITGFANSIVAPAMEFKREGLVMGTGAKLFSLAGPVLVFGISASVIIGVIRWLFVRG